MLRSCVATVAAGLLLLGCAAPALPPIGSASPALGSGAARPGPRFVSPYAYEWFVRAELARSQGDPAGAVQGYERVLAGDTEDPYVLARLAQAQLALGAFDAAEASLALALQLDPSSESAWLARGELAERRGQTEAALASYQAAARVAPDSAQPLRELARLLREQGHPERSLALWQERQSAATPGRAAAAQLELERALADRDPERVALWLTRVVREQGTIPDALGRGVRTLLDAGRAELAVPLLGGLGSDPAAGALRLQVLLAAAEYAGAEQLLASEPAEALGGTLTVVAAYLRLGQPERAEERLAEVAEVPGDWPRQRLAGQIALELARCSEAAGLLGGIPEASAEFAAALADLRHALRCAGLAEVATELGGG
jgi:tetratricopeptide (TPR) repeat protein